MKPSRTSVPMFSVAEKGTIRQSTPSATALVSANRDLFHRKLPFEVLLGQGVVHFDGGFDHLLSGFLVPFNRFSGDFLLFALAGPVRIQERLHGEKVDDTLEAALLADGHARTGRRRPRSRLLQKPTASAKKARSPSITFSTAMPNSAASFHKRLVLHLDPGDGIDHHQRALDHSEPPSRSRL